MSRPVTHSGPAPGLVLAGAAEALLGCRFRLHGRDPATGLDCVGLVGAALADTGRRVALPTGYRLRTGIWPGQGQLAAEHGLVPATGANAPGDLWLLRPGPGQLHLALLDRAVRHRIEAHAGLGRVVATPLTGADLPLARWRLAPPC